MNTILVCAADEYIREMLKSALADHFPLIVTEDPEQCLHVLRQRSAISKAFIAPEEDDTDMTLFKEASALRPELKMIAVGDHNTEAMAAEAVRHGAAGYILMPADANAILTAARC